jgi:hypothetical protein
MIMVGQCRYTCNEYIRIRKGNKLQAIQEGLLVLGCALPPAVLPWHMLPHRPHSQRLFQIKVFLINKDTFANHFDNQTKTRRGKVRGLNNNNKGDGSVRARFA